MTDLLDEINSDNFKQSSFLKRTGCFVIDFTLSLLLAFILAVFVELATGLDKFSDIETAFIFLGLSVTYFLICEIFFGKTLGRKITNTTVINN